MNKWLGLNERFGWLDKFFFEWEGYLKNSKRNSTFIRQLKEFMYIFKNFNTVLPLFLYLCTSNDNPNTHLIIALDWSWRTIRFWSNTMASTGSHHPLPPKPPITDLKLNDWFSSLWLSPLAHILVFDIS